MFLRLLETVDALRHRARARRETRAEVVVWRRGEDIAHRFLQRAGIVIVARNYRTASGSGEIDLIGWERDTLVIAEVKTRTSGEFGPPERAIGREKEWALARAAREYARHAEVPFERVRFDVVSVLLGTPAKVEHYRDAFYPAR